MYKNSLPCVDGKRTQPNEAVEFSAGQLFTGSAGMIQGIINSSPCVGGKRAQPTVAVGVSAGPIFHMLGG